MLRKVLTGHIDLTRADQIALVFVVVVILVVDTLLFGLLF